MKRVAVFGNAGGGKSTLAKRLSEITRLPLYPLDQIRFRPGGGAVPQDDYLEAHGNIIRQNEWIIDGYGCTASSWERFARADTLIYIDLSLMRHRWWVTKRLIKGLISTPEGWPEGSPIWRSTLSSLEVIRLCDRHLTPQYRQLVYDEAATKRVHHLKSSANIESFLTAVEVEHQLSATHPD